MKQVYLFRSVVSNQGTQGILITENFVCRTLELPWRNNKSNISCISPGDYIVKIRQSPKFGNVYWITNVKGRIYILIHSGNFAGDVSKGYKSHVNGCILLGQKFGMINNQLAVLNSRITIRKFMNFMNNEIFKLKIVGDYTIGEYKNDS